MANIQNIPIGEQLRISNPKVNQNFQNLNIELTGHISSKTAHKAEDITYTGQVPGEDVKEAIDNVNGRISEIVAQAGNDNTEIVDSRGGYPVLGDRLNAADNKLEILNSNFEKQTANVINVKGYGALGIFERRFGQISAGTNSLQVDNVNPFVEGCGILITGAGNNPKPEIVTLQIKQTAKRNGNIMIYLDGWIVTTSYPDGKIPVSTSDTVVQIADKIRACQFPNWIIGGTPGSDTITFTSTTPGGRMAFVLYDAEATDIDYDFQYTQRGSGDLRTVVTGVDAASNTITLRDEAVTTSNSAVVYTDDSEAVMRAEDALPDVGGVLYFPEGRYPISESIRLSKFGTRVVGAGMNSTQIMMLITQFTVPLLNFYGPTPGGNVGCGVSEITLDMMCTENDGIVVYKGWEGSVFRNVQVLNVGRYVTGFVAKKHPAIAQDDWSESSVSEGLYLENVFVIKFHVGGWGIGMYFEACQEITIVNSKAIGGGERGTSGAQWAFESCRGVTMVGCSAGGSRTSCINIRSNYRSSHGFTFIGNTFESADGLMYDIRGTADNPIYEVLVIGNRREGYVGEYYLDYVRNSRLETRIQPVTITENCSKISIMAEDSSQITDNGIDTDIMTSGTFKFMTPTVDDDTAFLLKRRKSGTLSVVRVTQGAENSAGSGYRMLRVPN